MDNRTFEGYSAVFRLLKHLCPNLNPETIISDWELAQQQAWQEAFPSVTKYHHNYFLHFAKTILQMLLTEVSS